MDKSGHAISALNRVMAPLCIIIIIIIIIIGLLKQMHCSPKAKLQHNNKYHALNGDCIPCQ